MKLKKTSQLLLASAVGLLAAGLLSACGTLTTDFVYVTSARAAGSNSYGEINIFEINSESGHMRQIPASPMYSGGRNPVAETVSADYSSLFVANRDDNTLVQFTIGSDGKLYHYATINTPGVYPKAVAMNASFLFLLDTYQPLSSCSAISPCSGSISVYPVKAATSSAPITLGAAVTNPSNSAQYWPLTFSAPIATRADAGVSARDVIVPTGVAVSGSYVFVSAYDSTSSPNVGYIFAYAVSDSGILTPVNGSPFAAGVKPQALSVDGTGKYLYAADYTDNKVLGFSINAGALTAVNGSPFVAGNGPTAIVVDPAYGFVYVANSTDSNVTAYSSAAGVLTRVATYASGSDPVAIGIDPSTHHFLYTANFLGSNVSGWMLSTTDGTLMISQGSPFSSNAEPTAVAAVPHK